MPKNDVQARSNQIVYTLQSAATQLEAVLKLYQSQVRLGQRKEDPLKLLQQLHEPVPKSSTAESLPG
jgi:exonuclease VII small subunit